MYPGCVGPVSESIGDAPLERVSEERERCVCEPGFAVYLFRVSIEYASPACRNEGAIFMPGYSGGREWQGEPRFEAACAAVFQLQFAAHRERQTPCDREPQS